MGLFAKKCSVCGCKLPDKRKFKGVCNPCGMDYQTLTKQMSDTLSLVDTAQPDGGCKACWEVAPLNKAGYCLECLARGTSVTAGEIAEYSLTHDIDGLSGDDIRKAATSWKLGRSALNAGI